MEWAAILQVVQQDLPQETTDSPRVVGSRATFSLDAQRLSRIDADTFESLASCGNGIINEPTVLQSSSSSYCCAFVRLTSETIFARNAIDADLYDPPEKTPGFVATQVEISPPLPVLVAVGEPRQSMTSVRVVLPICTEFRVLFQTSS